MKELIEYLEYCIDNKFMFIRYYKGGYRIQTTDEMNRNCAEKICEQFNELLLKVKRGELGKGEAEGNEIS